MILVRDTPQGATFGVRIHPRAKRDAFAGEHDGLLKVNLSAPPVEGKANEACIAFLAGALDARRSSITIVAGATSRQKVIRVSGATADDLRAKLQALSQA
ncbi:MAG: DUF167 domain-containing protein [Terriglobales bacterium]|jgi:uncharacterized protein (TIGR00251 family)